MLFWSGNSPDTSGSSNGSVKTPFCLQTSMFEHSGVTMGTLPLLRSAMANCEAILKESKVSVGKNNGRFCMVASYSC